MKIYSKIIACAIAILALASCRESLLLGGEDRVVARVGKRELMLSEAAESIPSALEPKDSVAMIGDVIKRWIIKELEVVKANVLLDGQTDKIDRKVEQYRQTLLIEALENHYIDQLVDTVFTKDQISQYYNDNRDQFKLSSPLIKGVMVAMPYKHRQTAQITKFMKEAKSEEERRRLSDVCQKAKFTYTDLSGEWFDYSALFNNLPIPRSRNVDDLLLKRDLQMVHDGQTQYLFVIDASLQVGSPTPLERVEETIRKILFNARQTKIIKEQQLRLYDEAMASEEVEIITNEE